MNTIALSGTDLLLCALLIVAIGVLSFLQRFALERALLFNAARMALQLFLVGFVIRALFEIDSFWIIALISLVMIAIASREVFSQQKRRLRGAETFLISYGAMLISTYSVTAFTLLLVINPTPWWEPRYLIPILGMILGNAMTAVSLAIDRVTMSSVEQKEAIEQQLLMGMGAREAFSSVLKNAFRVGMMPIINSMAASGIIHLPGMMTGQILAGNDPLDAAKYQIMIMCLIATSIAIALFLAMRLTAHRLFDDRDRLRLDRLR